jgi:hypothetical protein
MLLNIKALDTKTDTYKDKQVEGKVIPLIGGQTHFVHISNSKLLYAVSEYKSGAHAGSGLSVKEAIEKARENILGVGDAKYEEMILELMGK